MLDITYRHLREVPGSTACSYVRHRRYEVQPPSVGSFEETYHAERLSQDQGLAISIMSLEGGHRMVGILLQVFRIFAKIAARHFFQRYILEGGDADTGAAIGGLTTVEYKPGWLERRCGLISVTLNASGLVYVCASMPVVVFPAPYMPSEEGEILFTTDAF